MKRVAAMVHDNLVQRLRAARMSTSGSQFVLAGRRHPLTRVRVFAVDVPTGSRTHPWLYSGIPAGIQRKPPFSLFG